MEASAGWGPDLKRGALSLTFDNLGEAAEIEFGLWPEETPIGAHYTATETIPFLLKALDGLKGTFFIEAWNTEHYPEVLASIDAAGHEIGSHGWRHELWTKLTVDQQSAILVRALAAFGRLQIPIAGLRPPGGFAPERIAEVVASHDLAYVSVAGERSEWRDGLAHLPFRWENLDGYYLEPGTAERMGLAIKPGTEFGVDGFARQLSTCLDEIVEAGTHQCVVMHGYLLGRDAAYRDMAASFLADLKGRDDIWVAPCRDVSAFMALAH